MARHDNSKTGDTRPAATYPALRLVACALCVALIALSLALPSKAQIYQEDMQTTPEVYHESALRRFEIIFTISIPFTALQSYGIVRGVEMISQRKVSPKLSTGNWNSMAGLTILLSGSIAFWDWLHTRGEEVSDRIEMRQNQIEPLASVFDNNRLIYEETVVRFVSARF